MIGKGVSHLLSKILSEMVPPMNSDKSRRSGGAYTSLGTRQEGGRFEDVGLSLCALPLQILVLLILGVCAPLITLCDAF